jgi:hypothetical protein
MMRLKVRPAGLASPPPSVGPAIREGALNSVDLQVDGEELLLGNLRLALGFQPFELGGAFGGEAARLGFKLNTTHGRLRFGSGNEADL